MDDTFVGQTLRWGMSNRQRRGMTPDEFLAWEAQQDRKWEFDGFAPVAMTGGTFAHARIQGNILIALGMRLRGKQCQALGPDIRVPTTQGRYRYPDALVTCKTPANVSRDVTEPVVIFEVLSESTTAYDRTVKLVEYQSIPSVQRYVLLEQDRAFATVLTRNGDRWDHALLGPHGTLVLPEVGVEVPVSEFYLGLTFEPDTQAEPDP